MYTTEDYLERYKVLESWAKKKYGEEGVRYIEKNHYSGGVRQEVEYFRRVRNLLVHPPKRTGFDAPLLELTEAFHERFEQLCNRLMNSAADIYVPYPKIYKREINDKVLPTIRVMKKRSYSYVPVMNNRKVWGVFSETGVFNLVGDGNNLQVDKDLQLMQIKGYVTEYSKNGFYDFVSTDATIDDIRGVFAEAINEGRRLDVIYITTTGDSDGQLKGLITIWDISSL